MPRLIGSQVVADRRQSGEIRNSLHQ
ncbi:hypothetical protein LINGRAHAP2_LOCUS1764 [Linum grandiflorum]